ncbi:GNAT family N-acetyltransferase [Maricaulis salignorans]|uniref:Acetyltransferase involved in cellulose biosynthesis, CelD/BcsL family n=1 Tax=Maricaulis salignorans TaxID=144026 RepID=A0A1G9T934_9PROT|nr:GNAT family N-acetyltransferase [Maricaulis salignorans]SDM44279.1 Acetyltransferase involved in cellulose biosynthesis, CelD/BcsL family [Maricaulis salignorans]
MAHRAITTELVPISGLTTAHRAAWRGMRAENPTLASPYFALEFADLIADRRPDAQALVLTRKGRTVGFLPMQLSSLGVARPLGGPLGDHHALITEDDSLDLGAALQNSPVSVYCFHGALVSQPTFTDEASQIEPSWTVDLSQGCDQWLEGRRLADAKAMRNIRARQRKLAESGLEVTYRFDDRRPEALAASFANKREQYRRTNAFDVFIAKWARDLINDLFEHQTPQLSGCLSTLEINGQLAAAHFGMRSESVLHYWFPVYWPEYSRFGPGLQLFIEMAREMTTTGIDSIHLGPGDMDFKRKLANASFDIAGGRIERPSMAASLIAAGASMDAFARKLPIGRVSHWPGKALRRLDTLAAAYGI